MYMLHLPPADLSLYSPKRGTADTDTKYLSVENPDLKGSPLKAAVGQNIAMHASPAAKDFFLSRPFTYIISRISHEFSC